MKNLLKDIFSFQLTIVKSFMYSCWSNCPGRIPTYEVFTYANIEKTKKKEFGPQKTLLEKSEKGYLKLTHSDPGL